MTPEERSAEAADVATAYHVALTRIGVQTVADAVTLWQTVPATQRASQSRSWLRNVTTLIMGRREEATALARAYYRLVRALFTSTTIADPTRSDEGSHTSLNTLRDEFIAVAGPQSVALRGTGKGSHDASSPASGDAGGHHGGSNADDSDSILVEEIKRLAELEDQAARAAEEEIQTALQALGPANLEKLTSEIDTSLSADEVDGLRQAAHDAAAARQAAAAARIAMNGARATSWIAQENDKRAIGYVRVSQTGTPCGWCAMLISRGVVYKSKASAEYADGDKYHDNCHCIALPVYSMEQYHSDPRFDLNRTYAELWPQVTRGLGGKSAVSAWRRFIRQDQGATRRP